MKLLKARLRSSLIQSNFEKTMLISVEKRIAVEIKKNKDVIIDKVASTAARLSALLQY